MNSQKYNSFYFPFQLISGSGGHKQTERHHIASHISSFTVRSSHWPLSSNIYLDILNTITERTPHTHRSAAADQKTNFARNSDKLFTLLGIVKLHWLPPPSPFLSEWWLFLDAVPSLLCMWVDLPRYSKNYHQICFANSTSQTHWFYIEDLIKKARF